MYSLILAVHVLLAVFLVTLIMLQQGKGADMGAVMGSGGANSLFGVAGASNLLVKLTTVVAILFMGTSILLVRMANRGALRPGAAPDVLQNSVMKDLPDPAPVNSEPAAAQVTVVPVTPGAEVTPSSVDGTPTTVAAPAVPPAAPVAPQQTSAVVDSTPAASSGK